MFEIESFYLLKNPVETIIIKDKIFDPDSGILIFYQIINNKSISDRTYSDQNSLISRNPKELYFTPQISENNKIKNSTIYVHKNRCFSACRFKNELVIFSKKEKQFLFIQGYHDKLNDLGEILDSNQSLYENLISAMKNGIVDIYVHCKFIMLNSLNKNNYKFITISKILN